MTPPRRYFVAVRREARGRVPPDWTSSATDIPGVQVVGLQAGVLQVDATPEAIEALEAKLGPDFRVEELISHDRR